MKNLVKTLLFSVVTMASISALAHPEVVNFYKVTVGEGCRNFDLQKTISQSEANAYNVASPMAFCEERLKPQFNSEAEAGVQYVCMRKSQAEKKVAQAGCQE